MRVSSLHQIEFASLTDVGVRRPHNQDNFAVLLASDEEQFRQRGHLFLVADGMGAHAVGEKASEQAASVIPHNFNKHSQQGPALALRKAFVEANASIHACGQQNREFMGMGTTSTGVLLRPEGAWIAHVGDSRAYRIRGNLIEQLSYDHSLLWEYARLKKMDPADVVDIPSNVIHRCLGPEPLVEIDIEGPHPLEPGDVFLLCSDGLSGQVSDHELGAVASALPPKEACRFLVDLANLRGGPDNITVLIVRVAGSRDSNGVAPPKLSLRRFRPQPAWWLGFLVAGTVLAGISVMLGYYRGRGAYIYFLFALMTILVGVFGLVYQYYRMRKLPAGQEFGHSPPRIHRHASSQIDKSLLDKLVNAVEALRSHAQEKHWEPDWSVFEEHLLQAEALRAQGDLTGSFREYCRAMLPLTHALELQRNKEEVFQPVWDKSPKPV